MSIILATYILALSVFPCSEVIEVSLFDGGQKNKIELAGEYPDDNHNGRDNCSPFCVCDCCGATVITMEGAVPMLDVLTDPDTTPAIFSTLLSNLEPEDIWQPPKFS
jgi:hypothetical protein